MAKTTTGNKKAVNNIVIFFSSTTKKVYTQTESAQIETDFCCCFLSSIHPLVFARFVRANEVCVHDDFRSHHIKIVCVCLFFFVYFLVAVLLLFVIVHSLSVLAWIHYCSCSHQLCVDFSSYFPNIFIFCSKATAAAATLIYSRINLYIFEARVCFHNDM